MQSPARQFAFKSEHSAGTAHCCTCVIFDLLVHATVQRHLSTRLSASASRMSVADHWCVQFRRGGNAEQPAGMEYQGAGRPGITIGGAEGVTSRFRAPRRGQEDRAVADAMQVSARPCPFRTMLHCLLYEPSRNSKRHSSQSSS